MLQMYIYVDDLKFKELVSKGANPNISHPFQVINMCLYSCL